MPCTPPLPSPPRRRRCSSIPRSPGPLLSLSSLSSWQLAGATTSALIHGGSGGAASATDRNHCAAHSPPTSSPTRRSSTSLRTLSTPASTLDPSCQSPEWTASAMAVLEHARGQRDKDPISITLDFSELHQTSLKPIQLRPPARTTSPAAFNSPPSSSAPASVERL